MTVVSEQIPQDEEGYSYGDQARVPQQDRSSGKVLSRERGIVVLSTSLQVLYMDRQAQILISDLVPTTPEAQQSNDRTHVLPPALITLAGVILNALRSSHTMSEKGLIEIRHSVNGTGKLVSICGIGVPNGPGVEHARIVLLLTGTGATHSENHRSLGSGL
jgi:hypothetical protein